MKKYCNFCGEPMLPDAKECKQCGWDVSQNGPPTTDPGDRKARIGVATGLVVAYGVLWFLIQGTPAPASAEAQKTPRYVPPPELIAEPVSEPAERHRIVFGQPLILRSETFPGRPDTRKATAERLWARAKIRWMEGP